MAKTNMGRERNLVREDGGRTLIEGFGYFLSDGRSPPCHLHKGKTCSCKPPTKGVELDQDNL